jgi:methionyl-tRNA formyltransferase
MRVLVLGNIPSPLTSILDENRCQVVEFSDPVDVEILKKHRVEFAVSYRYRHLVKEAVIECLRGRIINLHISLLPWNRGADPNLWSFLEDTPKGVTIHYIDRGLDTGDIVAQREVTFDQGEATLATTYERLNKEIIELFREQWPLVMRGQASRVPQPAGGTFHRSRDKERYVPLLAGKGWETPVEELIGRGREGSRETMNATRD